MKKARASVVILFVVLGFLSRAGANERVEAAQDGRLIIRFSPTLGMNVGLVVRIDGRNAGAITRGHVFERYLSPGPHRLVVSRNGRKFDELDTTLNVRPGQTYSYVAKLPGSQIVLQPSGIPAGR